MQAVRPDNGEGLGDVDKAIIFPLDKRSEYFFSRREVRAVVARRCKQEGFEGVAVWGFA